MKKDNFLRSLAPRIEFRQLEKSLSCHISFHHLLRFEIRNKELNKAKGNGFDQTKLRTLLILSIKAFRDYSK